LDKITNIIITGVGGQGVLLASEIISEVAAQAGYDVKKSEIHGMSQRGGSVDSHVRFGEKVYSPMVMKGDCDLILAFEKLEALRIADFLKEDGNIIVNDQQINPTTVISGAAKYPENIEKILKSNYKSVTFIDALKVAQKAGNPRTVNTVLIGAVSKVLNLPADIWEKVIAKRVPEKAIDVNLTAFRMGKNGTMSP
jgi:indolepyruvate ferredoxin oxidoreductase beta subunit